MNFRMRGRLHAYDPGDGGLCGSTGWRAGFKRATCQLPEGHDLHRTPEGAEAAVLAEVGKLEARYVALLEKDLNEQIWGKPQALPPAPTFDAEPATADLLAVKRKRKQEQPYWAADFKRHGGR